jgi:hypothetical protein
MQKLQSEAWSRHDAEQGAESIGLVRSQLLKLGLVRTGLLIRTSIRSNISKYHGTRSNSTPRPGARHGHPPLVDNAMRERIVAGGGGFLIGHISGD